MSEDWNERANQAARAVTHLFGQHLCALPATYLGAITRPWRPQAQWHYWWQAHFLDCLVDTGLREIATGSKFDGASRPSATTLAARLITTVRVRNFFHITNSFYDDMAWLALALERLQRLEALGEEQRGRRRRTQKLATTLKVLHARLDGANTADLGGGVFWNTKRDFKNTPATAPVALAFVRSGRVVQAQALVDWLDSRLFDATREVYLDGIKIRGGREELEASLWTYNQGPVLGALVELGTPATLAQAARLVRAIDRELSPTLTTQEGELKPVRLDGTGDGGLFSGILVRYLALAANSEHLDQEARAIASRLVRDTARSLWSGASMWRTHTGPFTVREGLVFPNQHGKTAQECFPGRSRIELSSQLQAWMCLEAAATVTALDCEGTRP